MKYSKLRISVTKIEQFNRFLLGLLDEEALIEQIKTPFQTNEFFEVGKAWHTIIEKYNSFDKKGTYITLPIYDGEKQINFKTGDVRKIPELFPISMLHEYKIVTKYKHLEYDVDVVSKCDGIAYGKYIFEHKTTTKSNTYESYFQKFFDSYQWRLYCSLFKVSDVIYTIFEYEKEVKKSLGSELEQWYINIKNVEQIHFTKPEDNDEDCKEMIQHFVEFIHQHNLQEYFQEFKKAK